MLQPYAYRGEHAARKMSGKDKPCGTHIRIYSSSQSNVDTPLHRRGASRPPKVQVN